MSNDRILLDEVLEQERSARAPGMSASRYFELFTAEQILKDYDLSGDEIQSGLVGDGGDGGIDSMFVFVNGELVRDDFDPGHIRRDATLELIVVQAKMSSGFAETPIERFITVSDDILDLAKPMAEIEGIFNSDLLAATERFRDTYTALAAKFPTLHVQYYYACKGDRPETSVQRKGDKLKESVRSRFGSARVDLNFLGARELLGLARRSAKTTYTLALAENPVSSTGDVGFVALVFLRDYYQFITDDQKVLRRQIFEANVRDYQGQTEVNEAIQTTLTGRLGEDFWWLNNGVTIVASRASLSAKALTIEDPQIVNGLQTSSEVHAYFSASNRESDDRKLLVRVIVPSDAASRDRIIKATNSQTAIQQASLRATDKIHRDIEEYLRPRGLFYDRRKNYYKNEGKPLDTVIGIPQLAQATMAIALAQPDQARARPSSLLKDDAAYRRIYDPSYPIELYFVVASAMKRVGAFLKALEDLPVRERNNLQFYLAMHAIYSIAGVWRPSPIELSRLDPTALTDPTLTASLEVVKRHYAAQGANDKAAKGPNVLAAIQASFPN